MSNMVSPGVRVNLIDESSYMPISTPPAITFAMVGGASWGPINSPVLLTDVRQFINTFGAPIDQAGLTAVNTLAVGCAVYYCRFANASAAKISTTLTGTGGNLTLEAKEKGTLYNADPSTNPWKVTVTPVDDTAEFKLKIEYLASGATESTVVVNDEVLSCTASADNYWDKWENANFKLSKAGETAPSKMAKTGSGESATAVNFANQGNNGISATLADNANAVKAAAQFFSDTDSYSPSYFATAGYSSIPAVRTELVSISNSRKDCVFVIDHTLSTTPGSEQDTADMVIADLNGVAGDYNAWVGMWAMADATIKNAYNNGAEEAAYVSAIVVPAIGSLLTNGLPWTAPAGVNNLNLSLIANIGHTWTQAERDKLYAANINPILNYKSLGYTALGQKSGQIKKSAMDRLNVVQLVNYTKKTIESISVNYLFAPIDEQTFDLWVKDVTKFLNEVRARRGVYDFLVKMDWETVTPEAVNNNLMPGIVKIKPTKVSEFIDVDLVIKNYSDTL